VKALRIIVDFGEVDYDENETEYFSVLASRMGYIQSLGDSPFEVLREQAGRVLEDNLQAVARDLKADSAPSAK